MLKVRDACPKCKSLVFGDVTFGQVRNVCIGCGASHFPGSNRASIHRQITGEDIVYDQAGE